MLGVDVAIEPVVAYEDCEEVSKLEQYGKDADSVDEVVVGLGVVDMACADVVEVEGH